MQKTFEKLFKDMETRRKQLEEGNIPSDHALELLRQELRRDMGCPDDESLCGLVDGRLKERNLQDWRAVWEHEQIQRCAYCQEDIRALEEVILTPTKSVEPTTVGEMLKRAAQHHDLPDALNYKRDDKWHSMSSKEMFGRARAIALGLYSLGIQRGDRVALMSENCPEWTITDAGCQLAGVVDVEIPPDPLKRLPAYVYDAYVRGALVDARSRVLFIRDRATYARIVEAIEDCATLEHVVFFDEGDAHEASMQEARALTLAEVEARGRALDAEQPTLAEELAQAVRPSDLATIIYTSGTTEQPKPVTLTQENLVSNILACVEHFAPMFYWRLLKDESLVSLPLWHAPGRILLYIHLCQGVRICYAESELNDEDPGSLQKICDNINEKHPTVVIGTPILFKKIHEHVKELEGGRVKVSLLEKIKALLLAWAVNVGERWARKKCWPEPLPSYLALQQRLVALVFPRLAMGGRVRLLISVEKPLPDNIAWFYKGVGLPIHQGYGLTEASPVVAFGTPEGNQISKVWRPLRNVKVRTSAKGEIEIRGPNVMTGYYKRPDLTEKVFTEDGWLRTDDLGEWDEENRILKLIEPHGDVINIKLPDKEPIALEPIEAAIKGLPFVDEALLSKADDGTTLEAEIWPDFEHLLSDRQFKGIGARTEAELRKRQDISKYFQEQVDSLSERRAHNDVNIRVVISDGPKPAQTVTGKTPTDTRENRRVA